MTEHEYNQQGDQPTIAALFQQLPRATAPEGFEETTLLRVLLSELPRASAPEGFDDEVLSALRKMKEGRRLRLRRWRRTRTWLAIGIGAALVAAGVYYLMTRTTPSPQHVTPPAPPVLPLSLPSDTIIEEKLSSSPPPTGRQRAPKNNQPSSTPTKMITPGTPEHEDD